MTQIVVTSVGEREFQVEVTAGGHRTSHRVTVPERVGDGPVIVDDPERAVRESFLFLLDREPATSILPRFSLADIARYFPEYPRELARRLGC